MHTYSLDAPFVMHSLSTILRAAQYQCRCRCRCRDIIHGYNPQFYTTETTMTSFVHKVTSHRHCHVIYIIILIFSLTSCIIVTQWQTIALLIRWRPPECTDTTLYLIQREQIPSNIADQVIVNPPGSFLHRVEQYHDALSRMRTRILSN